MEIDLDIHIHPRRIENLQELDRILSQIEVYERKYKKESGVVIIQNRQLGGSYRVLSQEIAEEGLKNKTGSEFYVGFYPKSYFEGLREKLK